MISYLVLLLDSLRDDSLFCYSVSLVGPVGVNVLKMCIRDRFKALPTTVTLADKDTILAAQKAFDEYLALAGTTKGDVNNAYLLANAMTSLMNLEVKAVNDQIKALPKTITRCV